MSTHPLHPTHPGSAAHVARLRALCEALPEVTEKIAWGTPTWRVGGRVFAQLADHHHGNPHLAVWLAAPDGAQQALIEAEPERFFRPAYVGHLGWVAAILDEDSDWDMVAAVVGQAHRVTACKLPQRRASAILAELEGRAGTPMPAPAKKKAVAAPAKKKTVAAPAKKKAVAAPAKAAPAKKTAPPAKKTAARPRRR